jgi:hypothetical protein
MASNFERTDFENLWPHMSYLRLLVSLRLPHYEASQLIIYRHHPAQPVFAHTFRSPPLLEFGVPLPQAIENIISLVYGVEADDRQRIGRRDVSSWRRNSAPAARAESRSGS